MKKLNKVLAVLIILILIAGWTITVGGAGDKVGSIKDYIKLGLDLQGGVYVVMEAQTDASGEELRSLMTQTQAVIEKRVNEMGLTNPIVTIEGENRIRVELPGAEDAESAIEQIGKTAQLQFVLADGTVAVDGSNVKNAEAAINQQGAGYVVALEFDSEGATAFQNATQKIVNGEVTASEEFTNMGISANQLAIILDNEVISHPNVSVQNTILKFSYNMRMNMATRLLTTYISEPYTFHLNKNSAEIQRSLQIDTNQFMLLVNAALQFRR